MDGGQFFGDGMRKVERIDLYDFKVTFTESEGKEIISAAKEDDCPVEDIVDEVITLGLETFYHT